MEKRNEGIHLIVRNKKNVLLETQVFLLLYQKMF